MTEGVTVGGGRIGMQPVGPSPGLPSGDRLGGSSELVALPSRVAMCGRVLPLVMPRSLPLDHDDLEMLGSCGIPSTWQRPTARRPGGSPPPSRTLPREALPSDRRVVARGEVDGMRTLPTHLDTALPGRSGHPGDQPRGERMHVVRCSRLQLRRDLLQAV